MLNTATQPTLTRHAHQRCQQRGIRARLLNAVLENADVVSPAYGGSVLVSVSRARAEKLNLDDRLGHVAVVLSQDDGAVVTVAHIHGSRHGKAWHRGSR